MVNRPFEKTIGYSTRGMNTFFHIALKNLLRNKIRSSLTVLGVGVGIGVFISLLSISRSIQMQAQDVVKSYHFDISIQSKEASTPISSSIDQSIAAKIRDLDGIKSVASLIIGSRRVKWNQFFMVMGAAPNERLISQIGLIEGQTFSTGQNELIIGERLAKRLGVSVNDMLKISQNAYFKITGIYRLGSRIFDNAAIVNIEKAQRILNRGNHVNLIIAYASHEKDIPQHINTINQNFPALSAKKGSDFISKIRIFRTLDAFVSAISFISIFSCCVMVINTLLMAISERIKEIGILMAIGWNRIMIMKTIALEALLICTFGYAVGGLLGWLFLWILNHRNIVGFGWIPVYPDTNIMALSFLLSILLGIVSAVYPGIIATKMLPAKALTYE